MKRFILTPASCLSPLHTHAFASLFFSIPCYSLHFTVNYYNTTCPSKPTLSVTLTCCLQPFLTSLISDLSMSVHKAFQV